MKICSVCQRCYEDAAAGCLENHGVLIKERAGTRGMVTNYRLDSLLERDAVGESYLATNLVLDQSFVVRIIAQNLLIGAGEQARQTLQREAQAAADLAHPNIARVYESGWLGGGEFYVVTEFVGDKTLQGLLRNAGSLPEAEAVKIARQTAEGLMAAHTAGIVHRAVSPANITLARDSRNQLLVKLQNFDFGGIKQKFTAGKFAVDAKIETLRYLSPEQCAGKTVDAQTDVYSLGIVLYEMLCGRSPFNAPTSAAIVDRQIDEQPLTQIRFDVRALLTHTIKESLRKGTSVRLRTENFTRQLSHIAQLLSPLGDRLPDTPQVLMPNKNASDVPEFTEAAVEEQTPRRVIVFDETDAVNETAEQSNVAETETPAPDHPLSLGELAPVFVMKNEADPPTAAEPMRFENSEANSESFESNPILVGQRQVDEIPLDSGGEQTDETAANETSSLGELTPVFVMKNTADSASAISILAESEDNRIDSSESNPTAPQHRVDEIPFKAVEENQFDEISPKASVAQDDEVTTTKLPPLGELAPIFFEKNRAAEIPFEAAPLIAERQSADTPSDAPEVFVFPEENIKNTRKTETAAPNFTNYPDENRLPRRPLRANRPALVGAGLIVVLIAVILGAFLYNRMQHPAASEQVTTAAAPPTTQTASNPTNNTAQTTQPDAAAKNSAPIAVEKIPLTTASKRPDQTPPQTTTAINNAARQKESVQEQAAVNQPPPADGKPQTELNSALDSWISATNSRNVDQQMNYYAPKLNAYYLTRNASQGAVRAEKERIFSRADAVDIQTGKPNITLSSDGQRATMRFAKKYDIKQGRQNRAGEVLQELQWVKSGNGWRIVSERDVKVINR